MNSQVTYLKGAGIEAQALVGTDLSGNPHRLPFPSHVRAPAGSLDQVAEALDAALEQPGDRELWTTAPPDCDWNSTLWVETVECELLGRVKAWRRLVVRAWGSLEAQQDRYQSGLHAAQVEDPRVLEARIKSEAAAREASRLEAAARLAADLEDSKVLRAMTLRDLEIEMKRRAAAGEEEGAYRARRAYDYRVELAQEESAEAQMVELRARLAPGTILRLKDDLWEVSEVGYRNKGQDPQTVMVKGYCNTVSGSWPVEWWLRVLDKGEAGVYPPHKIRCKLEDCGVSALRAVRVDLGGRAAWVGRASYAGVTRGVWEDNGHIVRGSVLARMPAPAVVAS